MTIILLGIWGCLGLNPWGSLVACPYEPLPKIQKPRELNDWEIKRWPRGIDKPWRVVEASRSAQS